jgi:hypothetical protein
MKIKIKKYDLLRNKLSAEKATVGKVAGNLPANAMALCIMAYCFMTTGIIMLSIVMFYIADTSFLNCDEKKIKNLFF